MNYKVELRKNRKLILESILNKNSGISSDQQKHILRKATSIQNHTRGKLGELLGEVFLTANRFAEPDNIENDTATFDTPFGRRRVDLYWKDMQIALEAKMGYVYASKSILNQIEKDVFLSKNKTFSKVIWLLIKGGSKRLKQELNAKGIEIIEGWPLELHSEKKSQMTKKTIDINESEIKKYIESIRPTDPEIRKQVDIGYSFDERVVILYEIRPIWNNPQKMQHNEFAKIRYNESKQEWNLYWKRASGKWELYEPFPKSIHLDKMIEIISQDKHNCFYG